MNQATTLTDHAKGKAHSKAFDATLAEIRDMTAACMQCGTCTASCPNGNFMDIAPRGMWRRLSFGFVDEVLDSTSFWFCSSCYTCTLRCPRGLPLTRAITALKRLAALRDESEVRKKRAFYRSFVDNIEKFGRVQETSLMMHYFLTMKNPMLPLSYTPLGLKMMSRGKLHGADGTYKGTLKPMFEKVAQMEGAQ